LKDRAAEALTKGGKGGVFYLVGEDEFRKEAAAKGLVAAHLDPATADFNLDPLRGSEVNVERLASILATPPMMAEYRVVVLRETEALASSTTARSLLLGTAQSPPPGLAFILLCTVPAGSKAKFYRDLANHARSLEFPAIDAHDVPDWLMDRASEMYEISMEPEAARALGAAIGTNLGVLERELEKLSGLVGVGGTVTADVVERAGTKLPKQDRWRWFDLVGGRAFGEALDSLGTLLGQGESPVGLVMGVTTHLLRLGVVAEVGMSGLQKALPANQQWMARRMGAQLQGQARAWTLPELENALVELLRVDRLMKASGVSQEALLEEWLLARMAEAAQEAA
jgi:DNA polymerase-3 subunit delta